MRILYLAFYLALIVIAGSCAKVASTLPGGAKDETPPAVVSSIPLPGTVNFTGNRIEVTFDEYIVLDKLNEKFMVSPPLRKKPEIKLKGKTLSIEFMEELRDSSTYTLYFQDAVRDLNENNPYNNFQFVFSTGPVLDSLSVTGNVFKTPDLEAAKNVLILLHRASADTAPRRALPDYVTLSDLNGQFRIDNISKGNYRIYALADNNNNKKYDLEDELFAFTDSLISVNPAVNYIPIKTDTTQRVKKDTVIINRSEGMYNLFMSAAPPKKHYLKASERKPAYRLFYALSMPAGKDEFSFSLPDSLPKNYTAEYSRNRDSLVVWLRDSLLISQPLLNTFLTYPFTDSTGSVIARYDTIPLRFTLPRQVRSAKTSRTPLKVSLNIQNNAIRTGHIVRFKTETPLGNVDTSALKLFDLTGKERRKKAYTAVRDTNTTGGLFLKTSLKDDNKYLLIYDKGAFTDIYGERNDSSGVTFTVFPKTSYGHLEFDISGVESGIIVELLDTKEIVVARRFLAGNGKAVFDLLERGKYRARAILDLDGNGAWTTGDFDTGRQPEPIVYYPDEVDVKIDWIIEQPWDITLWNFKNEKLRLRQDK